MNFTLYNNDCLEILKTMDDNCVDSIVTDPPAGISFMGKDWDHHKGGRDAWIEWMTEIAKECLRVLKHGGHALVWSIPRTQHWTATAWENAGFDVRDSITHLFSQGFPKSRNFSLDINKINGGTVEKGSVKTGHEEFVNRTTTGHLEFKNSTEGFDRPWMHDKEKREDYHYTKVVSDEQAKQWNGWGTALKPATENWILLRKPLSEKTVAENVMKWDVGGLNIDACRIPLSEGEEPYSYPNGAGGMYSHEYQQTEKAKDWNAFSTKEDNKPIEGNSLGRFPSNFIHDGSDEVMKEFEQYGETKSGKVKNEKKGYESNTNTNFLQGNSTFNNQHGDSGLVSRFFYCAKASTKDKNEGCESNNHPTVKNTNLMKYFCKLITPSNGIVLDPFMGSGSTGKACMREGFNFIGIEKEKEYFDIAKARIENELNKKPEESKRIKKCKKELIKVNSFFEE